MYADDGPLIANWASQSPENLFRVAVFVQGTIQQHFERMPAVMRHYDADGLSSRFFHAPKRQALANLLTEIQPLYRSVLDLQFDRDPELEITLLRTMVESPGFGYIKGGFFVQLVYSYGTIGCLDRHNLDIAGLDRKTFTKRPISAEGFTRKLESYRATCAQFGGSAALWDQWCTYVSMLRPQNFPTPDHVSKLHVQCIVQNNS